MAATEALKITRGIDEKVEGVDERMKKVDTKVEAIDGKVQGVDDKVDSVIQGEFCFHWPAPESVLSGQLR